jgi:hypothetical protein
MFGDIAFMNNTAIIAGESRWVTTSEKGLGVNEGLQYSHFERKLTLLARPLRS